MKAVLASHAEVLLSGDRKAYLGSANLTEYGMPFFLDIGVTLKEGVNWPRVLTP